jgi:hypothetical protein
VGADGAACRTVQVRGNGLCKGKKVNCVSKKLPNSLLTVSCCHRGA